MTHTRNEGRETRAPSLLIWSQTRAVAPSPLNPDANICLADRLSQNSVAALPHACVDHPAPCGNTVVGKITPPGALWHHPVLFDFNTAVGAGAVAGAAAGAALRASAGAVPSPPLALALALAQSDGQLDKGKCLGCCPHIAFLHPKHYKRGHSSRDRYRNQFFSDTLPEWSKGVDSSSTSASCVGSNPTGVNKAVCAPSWSRHCL